MSFRQFMPLIKTIVILIVIGVLFVKLNEIFNFGKAWKAFVNKFWESWDKDLKKEKEKK